jgi:hypothetical protein
MIVRLIVGPSLGPFSYSIIGIYSNFLLLFSELSYLVFLLSLFYIFKKIIKNQILFLVVVLSGATFFSIIFLTIMNGLWLSPLF